ncbi:MAG: InlB B-repeat-containing protein, partial [Clostridia bacterium]|nr:InlB B-repeat-containing protein [Clostridia bacterium]
VSGTDYTLAYTSNTNVGTATITISGKGNFIGSTTASFEIVARDIANATINSLEDSTYTGSEITKTITDSVPSANTTLTNGTHYTVEYFNNVNVGTATIIITGIGNYTGLKIATFSITNATITGDIIQSDALSFIGQEQAPSLTNSLVAKGGQQIEITYSTSSSGTYTSIIPTYTNAGTYTVYYKATASNHGTLSGSFTITINAQKLSDATNLTWNGGMAQWSAVRNMSSYKVILYNGTTVVDTVTGLTTNSKDFSAIMTSASTSWKFTVQAIGAGNYSSSDTTTSETQATYTVTYSANGGSGTVPTSVVVIKGTSYTLATATFTLEGYELDGWNTSTDGSGTSYAFGASVTISGKLTLYAKWNEIKLYKFGTYEYTTSKTAGSQMVAGQFVEDASITEDTVAVGDYVAFGSYPQTLYTGSASLTRVSGEAFEGLPVYTDGTDKYVYVSSPNPNFSGYSKYSNGTNISSSTACYFKLEPMVWKVLSKDSNNKLLLVSEREIRANIPFYTSSSDRTVNSATVYANNYEYSTIRAYLNNLNGSSYSVADYSSNGFLNSAFTTEEQELICTTTVYNSASTANNSSYACANTTDKIFLLSYQDANTTYFSSATERIKYPTDFAGATYAYKMGTDGSEIGGYYWLRSPSRQFSELAYFVSSSDTIYDDLVDTAACGVVPALYLQL